MRRLLFAALAAASAVTAYVPSRSASGSALNRSDFSSVQFLVNDAIAPGMRSRDGNLIITEDSDPVGALQAAVNTWSTIPTSAVRFAPLQTTSRLRNAEDGSAVFLFSDSPELQSVVGTALAVTLTRFRGDGVILDTDIVFNANNTRSGTRAPYSTTLARGTFDLQSVATHELGHALGSSHSPLLGACMFPGTVSEADLQRVLSADDVAFASATYPAPGATGRLGSLSGRVTTAAGAPVRHASVVAVGRGNGVTIQALAGADGSYLAGGIPPGTYDVYAEPLDTPVAPSNFSLAASDVDTQFTTALAGTAMVTAGSSAAASISVPIGRAGFDFELAGLASGRTFGSVATRVTPGSSADVLLFGNGLTTVPEVQVLGTGMILRPGSVRLDPSIRVSGYSAPLRFIVDLTAEARDLGTVLIRGADGLVAWSGGLQTGAARPSFEATGVVNAASFARGAVAPGELVSLFGTSLGPSPAVALQALDPATGRVPTTLGGVSVTFDGIPAPLLYVSAGQVNAQVPYELSGRTRTSVSVRYQGAQSTAVDVPVVEAAPGIFVVVNQDGRVNSSSAPIQRGQRIIVYGTGQGVVDPPVGTGELAPTDRLLHASSAAATIGGMRAEVEFAGLTPEFAGLLQMNLVVPANAPVGDAVSFQISVRGQTSPSGTRLAVR